MIDALDDAAMALIALVGAANTIATYKLWRYAFSETRQKLLQTALVWLLPGIGAAIVLAVLREPNTKASGTYPEAVSLDVDPLVGWTDAGHDYFRNE